MMNICDLIYGMWKVMAYMNATWKSSTHKCSQLPGDQTIVGAVSSNTSTAINNTTTTALIGTIETYNGARSIYESLTSRAGDLNWIDGSFECSEFWWQPDCVIKHDHTTFLELESGENLKNTSESLADSLMRTKTLIRKARLWMQMSDRALARFNRIASGSCPSMTSRLPSAFFDCDIEQGLLHLAEFVASLSEALWKLSDMQSAVQVSASDIPVLDSILDRVMLEQPISFQLYGAGWTSDHTGVKTVRHIANIRNHARMNLNTLQNLLGPNLQTTVEQQDKITHDFEIELLSLRMAWPSTERQEEATKIMCHAAELFGQLRSSTKQASGLWSNAMGCLNDFFTKD